MSAEEEAWETDVGINDEKTVWSKASLKGVVRNSAAPPASNRRRMAILFVETAEPENKEESDGTENCEEIGW